MDLWPKVNIVFGFDLHCGTVACANSGSTIGSFFCLHMLFWFRLTKSQPKLSFASHLCFRDWKSNVTNETIICGQEWSHLCLCDTATSAPDSPQWVAVIWWYWPGHGKWGTLCSSTGAPFLCWKKCPVSIGEWPMSLASSDVHRLSKDQLGKGKRILTYSKGNS